MALRAFYNEIRGKKLSDLPAHLKPYFSLSYLKSAPSRFTENYYHKYIETNSITPLYHVCFGGMALSYLVALPEERRHLEHENAKKAGGHH